MKKAIYYFLSVAIALLAMACDVGEQDVISEKSVVGFSKKYGGKEFTYNVAAPVSSSMEATDHFRLPIRLQVETKKGQPAVADIPCLIRPTMDSKRDWGGQPLVTIPLDAIYTEQFTLTLPKGKMHAEEEYFELFVSKQFLNAHLNQTLLLTLKVETESPKALLCPYCDLYYILVHVH